MRVLVTGGAGFIGSHLVEALVDRGFRVRVLDDLSSGSLGNLAGVLDVVEFVRGDVRDPGLVSEAARGVDVVVHLAARVGVGEGERRRSLYWSVNVEGTRVVVEAAARAGVGGFVFASSAAVYGEPRSLPVSEDHPVEPVGFYGLTKVEGERLVLSRFGSRGVVLRLFNVYGPRQGSGGVVRVFLERASRGEPLVVYGDGLQTRDFVYVSDVVEAFILVLERLGGLEHRVYNVGTGRATRIIDLARLAARVAGAGEPRIIHAPPRPGDIKRSVADPSRLESLGWRPRVALEEGLRRLARAVLGL